MTTQAAPYELPEIWMELRDRTFLLELMEQHGMSQRTLAKIAGYKSHTYVQRLLRGEETSLRPEPAARIAHHFKLPFNTLFRTRASTDPAQTVASKRKARAA